MRQNYKNTYFNQDNIDFILGLPTRSPFGGAPAFLPTTARWQRCVVLARTGSDFQPFPIPNCGRFFFPFNLSPLQIIFLGVACVVSKFGISILVFSLSFHTVTGSVFPVSRISPPQKALLYCSHR